MSCESSLGPLRALTAHENVAALPRSMNLVKKQEKVLVVTFMTEDSAGSPAFTYVDETGTNISHIFAQTTNNWVNTIALFFFVVMSLELQALTKLY